MTPIGIAIVGLGGRTMTKTLDAIISRPEYWKLSAAVDPVETCRARFKDRFPTVPVFQTIEDLLEWNDCDPPRPVTSVYVAIPHHVYSHVMPGLLTAHLHVLKEKPAATTEKELVAFQDLAQKNSVVLSTASQRRYGHALARMKEWIHLVGELHTIEAKRKICVSDLAEGWRARAALAGGGAMCDIGWHLLDMVIGLLGIPSQCTPRVVYSRLSYVRDSQEHDCEDSAEISLEFPSSYDKLSAYLSVSRIGHKKLEEIVVTGTKGVLTFDGNDVCVHFEPAARKQDLVYNTVQDKASQTDIGAMFQMFYYQVHNAQHGVLPATDNLFSLHRAQDLIVTRTLQAIYQHAKFQKSRQKQNPFPQPSTEKTAGSQQPPLQLRMEWPNINEEVEDAVSAQLHEDISIYGSGGVIGQFEKTFKDYHGLEASHALLHNSGTNALYALYFAAGLMPGDEVIFPVYTFHATCSPAMHFGITPVFCDAAEDGNISASAIASAITLRTKAVVVTHMWGVPCDIFTICSVLKKWPRVLLLEDCSHAHGARFNGQLVGTFGDGAAWSLQGQKIVTGGEGGITLTKHADFHYRQLIFGHYNKRCRLEIPSDHHLYEFSLTGAGLKNRAHPLAVALALNQLRQLPNFLAWKTKYARQIATQLSTIPFLEMPATDTGLTEPAWYAFTMRFKAAKAPNGLTRELFVDKLIARGLHDVDIPRSTGLLYREPLYTNPQKLLPYLYTREHSKGPTNQTFDNAQAFYNEAIKIPVYATAEGQKATNYYIEIFLDVAATTTEWLTQDISSST